LWFKHILVAIDFSESSREALQVASRLAADPGVRLVLFHVWQPMIGPELPTLLLDDRLVELERTLADWEREERDLGAKSVSSRFVVGTPWQEIVDALTKDPTFDLVVVGTHGHTGLAHVLLGSVAERIVRHAPTPVLVVRARR
jgi:universal stress protein A